MKLIVFGIILISVIGAQAANYEQGTKEFGGSINIGKSDTSGTIIQLSPRAQYFIVDNLALGLEIDYLKSDNEEELGIGPSATYFLNFDERFVPFISQNILYKNYSGPYADGVDGLYATTSIGLNYPLSENTALSIAYQKLYSLEGDQDAEESESLSWGFRAYIK
ncbi:MAG: hypothetical protein R2827_04175 [Bdellovibrionales bacterium]